MHLLISPRILSLQVGVHEKREEEAHGQGADEEAVSLEVARGIVFAVGEAGDDTTKVTESCDGWCEWAVQGEEAQKTYRRA